MSTVQVSTAELVGAALDYAVARAEGMYIHTPPGMKFEYWYRDGRCVTSRNGWSPSGSWSQAGPLIEKYAIKLVMIDNLQEGEAGLRWLAEAGAEFEWESNPNIHMGNNGGKGETALIAISRAVVRCKLGNTVELPEEVVQCHTSQ